jgi:hypothetical protein
MADETEVTEQAQTIEQIAAEYNLSQESQAPKPEPHTMKTEPQPNYSAPAQVPDPVTDTDGFRQWTEAQNRQNAELQSSLNQTLGELNAERQRVAAEAEEKELNALVNDVATQLDGVPDKMVKYALADRYNSDPAFKAILDNRAKAPAAMKKAIAAILPDLRKDFSIKADPQIAENQRAMSEGTRGTNAPQSRSDPARELLDMNSAEFGNAWERIKAGG